MRNRYSKYLNVLIFIGDLLFLNFAYILSFFLKYESVSNLLNHLDFVVYGNLSWVLLSLLGKNYAISRITTVSTIVRQVIRFSIVHLLLVTSIIVFNRAFEYSREIIVYIYIAFPILLVLWRALFIYSIRIYRKYGFNYRNVIIVGYGDISIELNKFFRLHPEFGYKFLGYFDKYKEGKVFSIDYLTEFIDNKKVDEIYCCLPYIEYSKIQEIIDFGERNLIKVKLIADFRGFVNKGIEVEVYDGMPIMNVTSFPLDIRKNQFVKRVFDVAFSLIFIITIFSWLFPIVSLLILIDSKGPIFFKQRRTGKQNDEFWCLKFRTMYLNGDADNRQAERNDERVTRIGKLLRKTSLDELPQFINVFYGNMSVVGPRPHMLSHTREYSKKVEKFMARHFVKPGITGLAQTRGYRGEANSVTFMKNRVKLDRFYIQNWTLLLDLKIILLTINAMLKGDKKAY